MQDFKLGKTEFGILVAFKDQRRLRGKKENISFDKDWMNRVHCVKRSVINLTNHSNPLGDN
jgi:hypothetical protein